MSASRPPVASPLHRLLAAGSAALVLALTVFAASPTAHAWLHGSLSTCPDHSPAPARSDHDEDAGCAVVLFAAGLALPVAPLAFVPPQALTQGVSPVTAAELHLIAPRYLRQPERGPPTLG
jgi:hypothetical protein